LKETPVSAIPTNIKPMLATLVDKPFDRAGWLFEIKWDGYRAIAEVGDRVCLYSRNQQSFTGRYRTIVSALETLKQQAVLDGEIVVIGAGGRANFDLLQDYRSGRTPGTLAYYVFDLLYLDGQDLRLMPLRQRKELLQATLPSLPCVRVCEHIEHKGMAFFEAISKMGLEGMVAKDGASAYIEGRRTTSWLKVKAHLHLDAVIAGFTEPGTRGRQFGGLVLGVVDGNDLRHVGEVGVRFSERSMNDIARRLAPLIRECCPFPTHPETLPGPLGPP
jgi:bifunctional non-homologous end joining protein LigD